MGCFWGAERLFWQAPGVYTTAVGYAGGSTPNPTYEEVCSGRTGHTEVVLAVFDPTRVALRGPAAGLLGGARPDPGDAPGQRPSGRSTARRSTGTTSGSVTAAIATRDMFQAELDRAGYGRITTEIAQAGPFYYAEGYHQQYLAANPNGYCGLGGTGVLPVRAGQGRSLARTRLARGALRLGFDARGDGALRRAVCA